MLYLLSHLPHRFPSSYVTCEDDPQHILLLACAMSQPGACAALNRQINAHRLTSAAWGGLISVSFVLGISCYILLQFILRRWKGKSVSFNPL